MVFFRSLSSLYKWIAISYILFIVALAVLYGYKSYSPIPFGDSWNGYIDFFLSEHAKNIQGWWALHNEHRIFLSKLLYWIDANLFSGIGYFLILVNYFLLAFSALLFCLIASSTLKDDKSKNLYIVYLPVFTLCFSLVQNENITWEFQSHFFLAQILPLLALFFSWRSIYSKRFNADFYASCALGILSAGTLASGVLSLPILVIYALLSRQDKKRVLIYLLLSIFIIGAYFYGYSSPANHGSIFNTLKKDPLGVFEYVLIYVGSPFFHLAFGYSRLIALWAGVIFFLLTVCFLVSLLNSKDFKSPSLFLIFFIIYIAGTALGTAGGRLIFGIDQALSSRYTTPAILGWIALLSGLAPILVSTAKKVPYIFFPIYFLVILAPLPYQLWAIKNPTINVYDRLISGLALAIGVNDKGQIQKIYPSSEFALATTDKMKKTGLYFTNSDPFKQITNPQPQKIIAKDLPMCKGYLDEIYNLSPTNDYVSIRGWLFSSTAIKQPPDLLFVVNSEDKTIGYALIGDFRPDVKASMGEANLYSGFRGYIERPRNGTEFNIVSGDMRCRIQSSFDANKTR